MNGQHGISKTGLVVEGLGGSMGIGGSNYGANKLGKSIFGEEK